MGKEPDSTTVKSEENPDKWFRFFPRSSSCHLLFGSALREPTWDKGKTGMDAANTVKATPKELVGEQRIDREKIGTCARAQKKQIE